jgi:hypothetical protein
MTCGALAFLVEVTKYQNPFSKSLTPLLTLCFCAFLWKRNEFEITTINEIILITFGSLGTILLSVSRQNSKGILLMPLIVYISTLSFWKVQGLKFGKYLLIFFTFLISIPLFSSLQSHKLGQASLVGAIAQAEKMPWYLSPLLLIAERFDQFARVVDSRLATPGTLGGINSLIKNIFYNLQWNPNSGRTEISFGQQWNQLVTNQTIPSARFSGVSLAQGMIAEGFIWSGFGSLLVECLLISLIFIWIGNLFSRSTISTIFAFGLVGNGAIFETGIVSFSAVFSGSLKLLLFLWISNKIFLDRKLQNSGKT